MNQWIWSLPESWPQQNSFTFHQNKFHTNRKNIQKSIQTISKNRWYFQYPTLLFNIEKEIVTNRSKMDEAPSTGQYYWKVSRTSKSTFAIQLWLCKNKVNSRQRLHQDLSIICTFQNVWNLTYKKYWNHKFWKVQLLTGCLF